MAQKNQKILIIEDEETISLMYKTKLETDGFKVIIADNGVSGLELAKKEKPDIIILDVILPQLDGFSVLEELKRDRSTRKISVIMLTNLGTDEDRAKGEKLGAIDYLVKANLTPTQVEGKIKQYLKQDK